MRFTLKGAKINGRMAPLRTPLHNGDQIEITTSKAQTPSPTWERFVVTGKARANIRKFIRTQQRAQFVELGRSILHKSFTHEKLDYSEKNLASIFEKFKAHSAEDIYSLVGEGQVTSYEIIRSLYPGFQTKETPFTPETMRLPKAPRDKDSAISIKGLMPGMAIHYARCCHPLPGDQIVGIVMTGTGVTVHTINCDNLKNYAEEPERWLDLTWDQSEIQQFHIARLLITAVNKPNALATMTTIMSKQNSNIINLKVSYRSELLSEFIVDLEVHNTAHLENIIAHLRTSTIVNAVERVLCI